MAPRRNIAAAGITCVLTALACSAMLGLTALPAASSKGGEIRPVSMERQNAGEGAAVGRFSERSLNLGIIIHRGGATLEAFTLQDHPFVRSLDLAPLRAYRLGELVQVELVLHGPGGRKYTQRVEANTLCLDHGPETPPHVIGNTIFKHKQVLMTELPELPGFDRLEITYLDQNGSRISVTEQLAESKFILTDRRHEYRSLAFAEAR